MAGRINRPISVDDLSKMSQDSLLSTDDEPLTRSSSFDEVFSLPTTTTTQKLATVPVPQKRKNLSGRLKSVDKRIVSPVGRRQRFSEIARKRGPKPKLRGVFGVPRIGLGSTEELSKGDDGPGVENRLVLCSAKDDFVLKQDACVMCGAFGNDFEGRLISCAQCGQCYHPYCVNVKLTKVILQKGWRCLDCTVCEGCGQRNDEARLILCDDCDISYHIYCINPPLEHVPQGHWKCKWCAVCQICGSNSPGKNSKWHKNYSVCGPCNSLNVCPVCREDYKDADFIITCHTCERWLHGSCDGIKSEDEAEICIDKGYSCILCRPSNTLPPHLAPPPSASTKDTKANDGGTSKTLIQVEGTCLSEMGMNHIKSLTLDQPRKRRKKVITGAEVEAGILDAIESVVANSAGIDGQQKSEIEATDKENDAKKRQRALQKFGIGGFQVRLRGCRFKDEDLESCADSVVTDVDKPKRRAPRRKIKNKLVESFPSYLQEAFFGKELMDQGKGCELVNGDADKIKPELASESLISLSKDELQLMETVKISSRPEKPAPPSEDLVHATTKTNTRLKSDTEKIILNATIKTEEPAQLHDILPLSGELLDNDLVNTIMGSQSCDEVGQGLESLTGDTNDQLQGRGRDGHQKDELTDFFSSQFSLESMDAGLPSMDGKDVEDIFKGVLTDESQESQDVFSAPCSTLLGPPGISSTPSLPPNQSSVYQNVNPVSVPPGVHVGQGLTRSTSLPANVATGLASPVSFPPPSPYHSEYSNSPQFSPGFSEPPSPWPVSTAEGDGDQPSGSYSQRSVLKWEIDEGLNHGATISAVLYANMNHPELKRDYPNWTERAKQIAKIWRGLPADKRAPYLQKARENRAAGRIQKSQESEENENKFGSTTETGQQQYHEKSAEVSLGNDGFGNAKSTGITPVSDERRSVTNSIQGHDASAKMYSHIDFFIPSGSNTDAISQPLGRSAPPNHSGTRRNSTSSHQQIAIPKKYTNIATSQVEQQPSSASIAKALDFIELKCLPQGDQQIRVLTPSEIMQTLPALSQENYRFFPSMEQDKASGSSMGPVKATRTETPEERQWKQLQAYRQQHQLTALRDQKGQIEGSQDQINVVGNVVSPHSSYKHSPLRQLGSDSIPPNMGTDGPLVRQGQQMQMTMDQSMVSSVSPTRVQAPTLSPAMSPDGMQPNRTRMQIQTMPPPSPSQHYPPKLNLPQGVDVRGQMYSRPPYLPHSRHPSNEHFTGSPTTPTDIYAHPSSMVNLGDNNSGRKPESGNLVPNPAMPQGARQHLRDLLQRQQLKKVEFSQPQENVDGISPSPTGPRWAHDDWLKEKVMDHELKEDVGPQLPNIQSQGGEFRQPTAPPQIKSNQKVQVPGGAPMMGYNQLHPMNQQASRMHSMVQQQQQQQQQGHPRTLINLPQPGLNVGRGMSFQTSQSQHILQYSPQPVMGQGQDPSFRDTLGHRTMLDSYNLMPKDPSSSMPSMLAQQLGRPLDSRNVQQQLGHTLESSTNVPMLREGPGTRVMESQGVDGGVHQELPDSVTAELEKLEQEHGDAVVEGDASELMADLGVDDDELLGMGADFNILEYADPELDQVVGGEKTNILDNLDIEDEKIEKAPKANDHDGRHSKDSKPDEFSKLSSTELRSDHKGKPSSSHSMLQQRGQHEPVGTPQPPPPYPGPPPPYPGSSNTMVGRGNGDGESLQSSSPSMIKMSISGASSNVVPFPQATGGNSQTNKLLLHHPKTLLLQEQPLLLEDLLEQEKREQQRQGPTMTGVSDAHLLNEYDFERSKADTIVTNTLQQKLPPGSASQSGGARTPTSKAFMRGHSTDSLGQPRINLDWNMEKDGGMVDTSRTMDNPSDPSRSMHMPVANPSTSASNVPGESTDRLINFPIQSMPAPPMPPEILLTEQDRQMETKYEQWLYHQQHVLTVQLKYFDAEVNKLRKTKKSFNSKQRQLRKNGNDLNENDAMELEKLLRELNRLQKLLDGARKQSRHHGTLSQDHRNKAQKRQMANTNSGPSTPHSLPGTSSVSPHQSTPQSPMLSPSAQYGGPSPSPLPQNSPMASPLTPTVPVASPATGSLAQMSPRSSNMHVMDDRPFSPNNSAIRMPQSHQLNQTRMPSQQIRTASPACSPRSSVPVAHTFMSVPGQGGNMSMMISRGVGVHLSQQRHPVRMEAGHHMVATQSNEHTHRFFAHVPRFPRENVPQEIIRSRMAHHGHPNQHMGQMPQGTQLYSNPTRMAYSGQNPAGINISMAPIRSPSPHTGIGSPASSASQIASMQQNTSPVNSPMRRSSGSGNAGIGSPMSARPRSAENPLTPRGPVSGSQTPGGSTMTSLGHTYETVQSFENILMKTDSEMLKSDMSRNDLMLNMQNRAQDNNDGGGGGGGGGTGTIFPADMFSWSKGPHIFGLKGGSPFSVVTGTSNYQDPPQNTNPEQSVSTDSTPSVEVSSVGMQSDVTGNDESENSISTNETSEQSLNSNVEMEVDMPPPSTSASTLSGPVLEQGSESKLQEENVVVHGAASDQQNPDANGQQLNSNAESQNALLKQLLQNTGCASTTQVQQESSAFSLSGCLPARSASTTSHLSEAATRIPQPTPQIRMTGQAPSGLTEVPPIGAKSSAPDGLAKVKVEDEGTSSKAKSSTETTKVVAPLSRTPSDERSQPGDAINIPVKDSNSSETTPEATLNSSSSVQTKATEEEPKKAKRRQYQPKRRHSTGKDKDSSTPVQAKKRSRKGSKVEEDYDSYIETLMTQLRVLTPVGIVEPILPQNYCACAPPGIGDLTSTMNKDYSLHLGDLEGSLFGSSGTNLLDFYTSRGADEQRPVHRPQKQQPIQRGFYHQEFALPNVLITGSKGTLDLRSPSPVRDTDTPDTIVSSSSPEHEAENSWCFPGLKYIETHDENRTCRSPGIPLNNIPSHFTAFVKNEPDEMDKENKNSETPIVRRRLGSNGILRENGNIVVTLTVSSNAAQDVTNVLRNLENLLSVSPLSVFQVEQPSLAQKIGIFMYKSKDGKESIDLQSILNGAAKFCRHCDVIVLSNVIKRKSSDYPEAVRIDGEDELCFCSQRCLVQFSTTHEVSVSAEKVGSVVNHTASGTLSRDTMSFNTTFGVSNNDISNESQRSRKISSDSSKNSTDGTSKRWKNLKYKKWSPSCRPTSKHKKPTEKELTDMLFRLGVTVRMPALNMPDDTRKCFLCHQFGDSVADGAARLLNLDVDKWVHLNCALWSDEVYETESGALVNVEQALKQSLSLICVACKKTGATVKCFKVRCCSMYHLSCAVKEGCVFYQNKTVYCSAHVPKGEKENELTTLSVFRRVYIQRDENRQVASVMHHADQHQLLRVGSLIFLSVGQLLPHQLQAFHSSNYIYPIGYKIIRYYWSMTRINKRCQYVCSIHEVDGKPEFRITPKEESSKESTLRGESASKVWLQVLEAIAKLRTAAGCIKLFPKYIRGEDLFGLTEPTIVKVLESLPGIETLNDYHFKYGRNPLLELPLAINPTGCARSEPKLRTHFKRPHTQRTGSSRASYSTSIISSSEISCPYSKQFVHSKSSQYKKMKQDWRNNVYLARSKIQGLGLYAARDIEKHTMVIEYIGEIIRSELAETREKKYEAQNRGIYMFRVDEDRVIDATLCGGLARYINHSCNPNCVAETVEVDRDLRIIIFANRRISRGEELAYDYKFEFEDDGHKIPCCCGAPNCREWMN